jgi:hypothetical protein
VSADDLTPELVRALEALTPAERARLVTPWSPWWEGDAGAAAAQLRLSATGQLAVQELRQQHPQHQQQQHRPACGPGGLPAAPQQPLPSLRALAGPRHAPSPLLPWQLLQLLVAYCGVLRTFNGEPGGADDGLEAGEQLLGLAPPLAQALQAAAAAVSSSISSSSSKAGARQQQHQQHQQHQHQQQQHQQQQHQQPGQLPASSSPPPDSARSACMQLVEAAAARQQQQVLHVALADAHALLQLGPPAVLLALADTHRLLLQARDAAKQVGLAPGGTWQRPPQHRQQQVKQLSQGLRLAAQKLWYLMVWFNDQQQQQQQQQHVDAGALLCRGLAGELAAVLAEREAMAGTQQQQSIRGAPSAGGTGGGGGGGGGVVLPGAQAAAGPAAVARGSGGGAALRLVQEVVQSSQAHADSPGASPTPPGTAAEPVVMRSVYELD